MDIPIQELKNDAQEPTEAERIKAERDLLRIKLEALERSFMDKKSWSNGKEPLRKA